MRLKHQGWSQRNAAEALGVREETISRWMARARHGGSDALLAHPGSGHPPEGKVYTLARQESLNGLHTIEFLIHSLRVAGKRSLVIGDGSPIHRRAEVQEFVESTRGGVRVESLPGYAPDLNPWDEGGWHHLEHVELRNVVGLDLEQWHEEFHAAVSRWRRKPHLVRSCFAQAGLSINPT